MKQKIDSLLSRIFRYKEYCREVFNYPVLERLEKVEKELNELLKEAEDEK